MQQSKAAHHPFSAKRSVVAALPGSFRTFGSGAFIFLQANHNNLLADVLWRQRISIFTYQRSYSAYHIVMFS
jgi:hypothetical protein